MLIPLQDKLRRIGARFESVMPGMVFHYFRPAGKTQYLIWAEDGEGSSARFDRLEREQSISGSCDYYTKQEYDPYIDTIQEVLNDMMLTWRLNSVQYEEDTRLIHYEWRWEAAGVDG